MTPPVWRPGLTGRFTVTSTSLPALASRVTWVHPVARTRTRRMMTVTLRGLMAGVRMPVASRYRPAGSTTVPVPLDGVMVWTFPPATDGLATTTTGSLGKPSRPMAVIVSLWVGTAAPAADRG